MGYLSYLGLITIVVIWVCTGLAFLSVLASALAPNVKDRTSFALGCLNYSAIAISLLLVVQTTWGFVCEGGKQRQADLSNTLVTMMARVSAWDLVT